MNQSPQHTRTIAITGASGLLGRHLCDYFRKREWQVNALVRDDSRYYFGENGIQMFKCVLPDMINLKSFDKADVVIHCAYMTRFTNLDEAREINEEGTARILDAARAAGAKKIIFISSRAASPHARSYYGESKYKLESLFDSAQDLIVRPGLVLASDGGLFYRIVKMVRKLPIIPAFGGKTKSLKTIHIDDLCKVIDWAIENDRTGLVVAYENEGVSMKELLEGVLAKTGHRKIIVPLPGMPFVLILRLLEILKIPFPVSSENLCGFLGKNDRELSSSESIETVGIRIRPYGESVQCLDL